MANDQNPLDAKKPSKLDWKGNRLSLDSNAPSTTKNLHRLVAERKAQMAGANSNRVQAQASKTNKKEKDDIFTRNPRGSKKRTHDKISDEKEGGLGQKHSTSSDVLDEEEERRRKHKMEEKSRLYDDLKRGYVDDKEGKYNVDFDRKWAEAKERGEDPEDEVSDREAQDDDNELVDYVDEFGRNRRMTKREVAKAERMKKREEELEREREEMSARPKMPEKLIHGDYVQTHAFDYNRYEKEFTAAKERYENVDSHFAADGVSIYDGDYPGKQRFLTIDRTPASAPDMALDSSSSRTKRMNARPRWTSSRGHTRRRSKRRRRRSSRNPTRPSGSRPRRRNATRLPRCGPRSRLSASS